MSPTRDHKNVRVLDSALHYPRGGSRSTPLWLIRCAEPQVNIQEGLLMLMPWFVVTHTAGTSFKSDLLWSFEMLSLRSMGWERQANADTTNFLKFATRHSDGLEGFSLHTSFVYPTSTRVGNHTCLATLPISHLMPVRFIMLTCLLGVSAKRTVPITVLYVLSVRGEDWVSVK